MNNYLLALYHLTKGIQTIPLDLNKKPLLSFKDTLINQMFIDYYQNIYTQAPGLGALTRGIWCIDIDLHDSNGFESLKLLPHYSELVTNAKNTLVQTTPSGGQHIIFKKRGGVTYGQKIGYLDGVDIKAHHNNYFVLGGSKSHNGIYTNNGLDPQPYQGKLENRIFSTPGSYEKQILEKYSVKNTLKNYDFSHLRGTGKGGLGKQAYERIINGQSIERNNDLYLASTYAKQCGIDLEPLRILIGDVKQGDVFTESEWIATVNSANS